MRPEPANAKTYRAKTMKEALRACVATWGPTP